MKNRYLPEGLLSPLPENREYLASAATLERAMNEGVILEATVLLCDTAMRLHVDLGCMRGIIERHEAVATRRGEVVKDIAIITRVGKPVCFKVVGFTRERMYAKLSCRPHHGRYYSRAGDASGKLRRIC